MRKMHAGSGPLRRRARKSLENRRAAHRAALDRLLQQYSICAQFADTERWQITWHWSNQLKAERSGLELMITVVRLLQWGRIDPLRRCYQCEKWFVARVHAQGFCSAVCRNEFHSFNPDDKKRRADWARSKYQRSKKQASK